MTAPSTMIRRIALSTPAWPVAALLLIAVVYVVSLPGYPGPSGDNAEFQRLARTLGTSHPTGYPLYLLASHAFQTILPGGSLAWRVNLFSTVCGLGALALFWRIGLRLGLAPWSVAIAMAWLATTSTWWRLSTVAEVYSLHALLTLGGVLCILKWRDLRDDRFLRAAIFLHALSYANHLTTLLVLPALLYLVAATDRRVFTSPAAWRWCGVSILAGLAFYGYVLIQARTAPPELVDTPIDSMRTFLEYITGAAFHSSFSVQSQSDAFLAHIRYIPHLLWQEWGWFLPLMAAGLPAGGWRGDPRWRMLALLFGIQIFMVFVYRIPDIQDYLLLPAAAGAWSAARLLEAAKTWAARGRGRQAVTLLAVLFLLAQTARSARDVAVRIRYRGGREDAEVLLEQIVRPRESALLLLPHWKQYSIARYYTLGEERGGGRVRAELWQTDRIRGMTPAEIAHRLEEAFLAYPNIRLYGREGNPGYDLPGVLTGKGVSLRAVNRFIWEITPPEAKAPPPPMSPPTRLIRPL